MPDEIEAPPADPMNDFISSLTAEEPPQETPAEETKETPAEEPKETPAEETKETPAEETKETPAEETKEEDDLKLEEGDTPKDEDEEKIPEKPTNRKDWDTLRASRDRHKAASEAKEEELAELRQLAARVPEMEEKLKLFDTYEKEIAVTRLEVTKEYQDSIAKPLKALGETAKALASANEADVEAVYEALKEPDLAKQRAAIKEVTSGWDDLDRAELVAMAKDARVIFDKQDSMRANAAAAAAEQKQLEEARLASAKEAARKEFTDTAKDVVKALRGKTPDLALAEGETMEDKMSNIEQRTMAIDFDAQPVRSKAFAAAAALIYPDMKKTIEAQNEEIATLKARIKEKEATDAKVGTRTEEAPPESDEGKDFFEAMGIQRPAMLSQSLNVVGQ